MKHISTVLIFISISVFAFSQDVLQIIKTDTVKLEAKYNLYNGYQSDSAFSSVIPCMLYMGKEMTLSVYEISTMADIMKSSVTLGPTDPALKKSMDEQFAKSEVIKRSLTASIIKVYSNPSYYTYKYVDEKNVLVTDTSNFSWSLTNDTKKIEGFLCQKAVLVSDPGVTAWFTRDIPVYGGPGYISGLPGLVLEYYNTSRAVAYKMTALLSKDVNPNKFRDIPKDIKLVSQSEFAEMAKKDDLKLQRMQHMIESGKKE